MRPDRGAARAAWLILPVVLGWTRPAVCAEAPASPSAARPALDRDFPDPDVVRVGGGYYAYATGRETVRGPVRRLSVSYSRDLARWTASRDPLAGPAAWARPGTSYWARHVVFRDGR